jgi:hypothetical protein
MVFKKLIMDADFCIKLGASIKYPFLYQIISCLSTKAYIHKYVYDMEILSPSTAKTQLKQLIDEGILELIDENILLLDDFVLYRNVYNKLFKAMLNPDKPKKNKGEILSLAMARVIGIPVFVSDESDLQKIVDININKESSEKIKCIRIIDIIEMIKCNEINGFNRRDAKNMWIISGNEKEVFDNEIWVHAEN